MKKPYVIAMMIQVIYAGMFVVSKAAFDHGFNTFVFIFYRQAAATLLLLPLALLLERKNARSMSFMLLLKLFLCAFIGNTFSLNLYNVSMKFTSATVASAASNSLPVITFFLALVTRMESVKLRSSSGIAKLAGVALCFAGVMVLALYKGPALNPVNHHHIAFAGDDARTSRATSSSSSRGAWIRGIFLMVLANVTWSIWIVLQAAVLKEFPNNMLVTATQCVFSTVQTLVVAVAAERDIARWKLRLDITLLAVLYTGLVVTGMSYYLQAWCVELKGPVFLAMSNPLCLLLTIFCSSFLLADIVHLGSIIGGILLVGGLYSVLWGKSTEMMDGNGDEHHKIPTTAGSEKENNNDSTTTKSPLQQSIV